MTSERVQRRIERLLDQIDAAEAASDWVLVSTLARDILDIDDGNREAIAYLSAAERRSIPARETSSPGVAESSPQQPTSFANGRYEVKRFLGEGGKKKVYLAHDARLDRDVAFALIKAEGLDDAARERITREAQAMGRLGNHPNIVTVYDIGDEDGQPFMVLPVLAGGDVEGVVEKAPEHKLPIERAVQIAVDTCQGLELAHSRGIIHRDLKPGNVWLTEDGTAMIGDFGLAVAVDRSRLTQAGMMVGTVSYMPPEQAMGGEVSPRSDLYSLGAMLYEMVCGRPPFVGDESVAIIGQHLNTPPVAPTWHRPDCPPALETLLLRLLEKDPEKRPASAAEVREALRAVDSSARTASQTITSADQASRADPLYRTVFVGRENELKQLQQAFDAAMSGLGGLVMVVGEPGIGKTALCEQLATYVSIRGGRTLVGHCYEEGSLSLPYLAFVEAMRTYVLTRDPDGLRSDLGSGAADVARIVSEVRDRVNVELRDASDPEDDRWRLLQSVTTFLRNAASVQPLVIVLEDLHWADRGTLDLLQHVARNLQGARLVVVGTYRDVEVDRTHPLSGTLAELRRIGNFLRIPLRGLTVDEVHRMYEAVRGQEVPWGQAELVHRQTEGNPLFVQEVLRYLVEEGIVVREGGRYVAQGLGVGIPDGLRDVVGKRLSRLDDQANQVLSVAAVIGRDFRLDVLQRVAVLGEDAVLAALEEAQERAIIEQRDVLGTVGFRFTHAFFRQTLYEEIFTPRRIRLHQQVGRALEEVYARRLEEHAAELAEHFTQSTEADDLAKAVRYGELAAQRAMNVFAYGEAVRHLEQALRAQDVLDPDNSDKRCDLLCDMAWTLRPAGEAEKSLEMAEQSFQLAEAVEDRARASNATRAAAYSLMVMAGMQEQRRRWAQRADAWAAPDSLDRVHADILIASSSDDLVGAKTAFNRALGLARRLNDPQTLARAALLASSVAGAHERLALAEEFWQMPRTGISPPTQSGLLNFCSWSFLTDGQRERVQLLLRQLRELHARTHEPLVAGHICQVEARQALLDGNLLQVAEITDSFRRAYEGFERGQEVSGPVMQRAAVLLGRRAEQSPDAEAAEQLAEMSRYFQGGSGQNPYSVLESLFGLSGIRFRWLANEALEYLRSRNADDKVSVELDTTVTLALLESAILTSTLELIPDLEERAASLMDFVWDGYWHFSSPARLLGEASALLQMPMDARKHFEAALGICERVGFRPELALSRLDLAELLLEHYPEERDAAIEHLDLAIAEFQDMKMQPALERALRHRGLLKA